MADQNYQHYWSTSRSFPARQNDILEVGRWGRILRNQNINYDQSFQWINELVYETVRLRYYSGQLSRFEAFFFFDSLDSALQFANGEFVYEIELLDPSAKIERHIINDFGSRLYPGPDGRPIASIAGIEKHAHSYWNYAPRPQAVVELLTLSPARVVRKL